MEWLTALLADPTTPIEELSKLLRAIDFNEADNRDTLLIELAKSSLQLPTDRQKPATMLNAPPILTPMAMRLGDYFIARNQPYKAVRAYEEALLSFPNDAETMTRLEKAKELAKAAGPEPEEDEQPPTQ